VGEPTNFYIPFVYFILPFSKNQANSNSFLPSHQGHAFIAVSRGITRGQDYWRMNFLGKKCTIYYFGFWLSLFVQFGPQGGVGNTFTFL